MTIAHTHPIVPALPAHCPACSTELMVTRLACPACGTEVAGAFTLGRLAGLSEPHASLIELFLRLRGNTKEMERVLGLSYPTVRARLEDALTAAGMDREGAATAKAGAVTALDPAAERGSILDALEQGEITPTEAAARLRGLSTMKGRT